MPGIPLPLAEDAESLDLRAWVFGGRVAVGNARREWRRREGVLLQVVSRAGGPCGWGEASPLPGFSPDGFDDVVAALRLDPLESLVAGRPLPAALRFGLETALLDRSARREEMPVHARWARHLGVEPREELPVARLVDLSAPLDVARLTSGGAVVKIKIGRPGAFGDELEALRSLRRVAGPDLRLRLDANRGLDPERLEEQLEALAGLSPEMVEEPVPWEGWPRSSPVPLALDETLGEWSDRSPESIREALAPAVRAGALDALVLKPALVGGFLRCAELARLAEGLGLGVVVSHLFDGPVGLAAASALALGLPGDVRPAGLAPHAGLEAWPATPTPWCRDGRLRAPGEPGLAVDPAGWLAAGREIR